MQPCVKQLLNELKHPWKQVLFSTQRPLIAQFMKQNAEIKTADQ